MADTTFGVRVPEEMKNELTEMMQKSGKTGKEFMQTLMEGWKIGKVKDVAPAVVIDFDEFTKHINRASDIFLNSGVRIETMIDDKTHEIKELKEKSEKALKSLKEKMQEKDAKIVNIENDKNEAINAVEELEKRLDQIGKSEENLNALVTEYKEKNDTLAGMLAEYKHHKVQNVEFIKEIQTIQTEKAQLAEQNKEQAQTIADLKKTIEKIEKQAEEALQMASEKAEMKLDKALLEQEKKNSATISQLKAQHSAEITEYQDKYKAFLEEIKLIRSENDASVDGLRKQYQAEAEQLGNELAEAKKTIEQLQTELKDTKYKR